MEHKSASGTVWKTMATPTLCKNTNPHKGFIVSFRKRAFNRMYSPFTSSYESVYVFVLELNIYRAAEVRSIGRGVSKSFRFDPVEGRYVNIYLPGNEKILTLCEVEVFAGNEGTVLKCIMRQSLQFTFFFQDLTPKYTHFSKFLNSYIHTLLCTLL